MNGHVLMLKVMAQAFHHSVSDDVVGFGLRAEANARDADKSDQRALRS